MADKYVFLSELEKIIGALGKSNSVDEVFIPQLWQEFPLTWLCYGERDVCIRESSPLWSDEDVMSDIISLFDIYYTVIVDKIKQTAGINTFDERYVSIYVQPDYLDTSVVLVVQRNINNLAYVKEIKPWHMAFETPEEMEFELKGEYELILRNIK